MSQESADLSTTGRTGRPRVLAGASKYWRIIRSNQLATAGFLIVLGLVGRTATRDDM